MDYSLDHFRRDVRDAARSLARRSGFTTVAVLSLAIGIGANTAIFSLVNAIVLGKTPVERPERIVNVYLHQAAFAYSTLSYPEVRDLRDGAGEVFTHIGDGRRDHRLADARRAPQPLAVRQGTAPRRGHVAAGRNCRRAGRCRAHQGCDSGLGSDREVRPATARKRPALSPARWIYPRQRMAADG